MLLNSLRDWVKGSDAGGDVFHYITLAAAALVWLVALQRVQMSQLTDVGLIRVLPVASFLAISVVALSFCVCLLRAREPLVVPHIVLLIVMLYAIPNVVEAFPRVSVTYRHIGIVDYIDRTQRVVPSIDAYFNWPGFFILSALLKPLTGLENMLQIAAWAPLFFNLLYLPPLFTIASSFTQDRRHIWLACWCFYLANWVNQDYLSPQAFALFFYLVVLALVIRIFRSSPTTSSGYNSPTNRHWNDRLLAAVGSREMDQEEQPPAIKMASMVIIILASAAAVASHQLTPFALLAGLVAIILLRRTTASGLALLVAVLCVTWLEFMAITYLKGNIKSLVDSVGELGGNVGAATISRVQGTPGHLLIVKWSFVMTALFWIAAGVGVLIRIKRGRWDVTCACLAVAPFSLMFLQPYGGEILLRVYLFALPFMSVFVAVLLAPKGEELSKARTIAIFLASAVLIFSFLLLRYGNEKGIYFPETEIAAMNRLYDEASPRSLLVAASPSVPWKFRHYEYPHEVMSEWDNWRKLTRRPPKANVLIELLRERAMRKGKAEALLIITATQNSYAEMFGLAPASWITRMELALSESERVDTLYERGSSVLLRVEP
ncbi:MAG: hypothetical protein H0U53_03090 [Actinobacteria bacterium]|nr:hypothetical protein [Actinomycetota bacterium]